MTPDLRELYQETILDHSKKPHNFRSIPGVEHHAEGYNPLCGDKITVYVDLKDGVVRDIGFQGSGCAISKASASMMSDIVKGKTEAQAAGIFKAFHDLVTGRVDPSAPSSDEARLGKLAAFAGVSQFPVRVKCATLAWHTLRAAIDRKAVTVSTE